MFLSRLTHWIKTKSVQILMSSLDRDLSGLFYVLDETYEYVICKFEGCQSDDFPYTFLLNSEIDILCNNDDLLDVTILVKEWMTHKYRNVVWVEVGEEIHGEHALINIYVVGLNHRYRCFCVDIQIPSAFHLSNEYLAYCIRDRLLLPNGTCYINSPRCDIPIRAYESYAHPHKIWHLNYIKKTLSCFDPYILNLAYGNNQDLLKSIGDVIGNCAKSEIK